MRAADAGYAEALTLESFVTLFIRPLFCRGIGPFRWIAVFGDARDIEATEAIATRLFPAERRPSCAGWSSHARTCSSRGSPPASAGLDTVSAAASPSR